MTIKKCFFIFLFKRNFNYCRLFTTDFFFHFLYYFGRNSFHFKNLSDSNDTTSSDIRRKRKLYVIQKSPHLLEDPFNNELQTLIQQIEQK